MEAGADHEEVSISLQDEGVLRYLNLDDWELNATNIFRYKKYIEDNKRPTGVEAFPRGDRTL